MSRSWDLLEFDPRGHLGTLASLAELVSVAEVPDFRPKAMRPRGGHGLKALLFRSPRLSVFLKISMEQG